MAPSDWLPFLTVLADRADEIALRGFRKEGLRVEDKPDLSPVTEADRAIEETVRTVTRRQHPELGLLGEEQGAFTGSAAARLIVDPIDATRNFVRGIPVFATLLAIEEGDEVVAGGGRTPAPRARRRAAPRGGGVPGGGGAAAAARGPLRRGAAFLRERGAGAGIPPPGSL